jgi:molecular chaperone DnaK
VTYGLGVDLGTTYTAAAVRLNGRAEVVQLGGRRQEIPSLVFVRADGEVLIGEAAERRGAAEPARLAREFKRRVGDPVPILVGGSPYSAHALMARMLEEVFRTVSRQQEGAPAAITVTHPANWGPYKRELLHQATRLAELDDVTLRSEPEAAAVHYAAGERVQPDEVVAVYDLGGGTFDAAVLRKTVDGFSLLGEPEGIEQLGGIDFDEAVFGHVMTTLGDAIGRLDPDDEDATAALARLRRDCVEAKEALSYDTEVMIPIALPGLHTRVRLNRSEFEAMIAPALAETVAATRRALRSAGVTPAQLRSIVLAGGSSRIPLVGQLLGAEFSRPLVLDPHPEHSIALGAALVTGHAPAEATKAHPAPTPRAAAPLAPPAPRAPQEAPTATRPMPAATGRAKVPPPSAPAPPKPGPTMPGPPVPVQSGRAAATPRPPGPAPPSPAPPGPAPPSPAPAGSVPLAGSTAAMPSSQLPPSPSPRQPGGPAILRRRIRLSRRALIIGIPALVALLVLGGVGTAIGLSRSKDDSGGGDSVVVGRPTASNSASAATSASPAPVQPFSAGAMLMRVDRGAAWPSKSVSEIFSATPGTPQRKLLVASGYDILPTWSHDRSKIAFTRRVGNRWQAWVMNADGTGQKLVTDRIIEAVQVTWTSDDKRLAFITTVSGRDQLFTIAIGETQPVQITNTPDEKSDPSWSPAENLVVIWSITVPKTPAQLFLIRPDQPGAPRRQITSGPFGVNDPVWSPDGKRIAYTRDAPQGGVTDIWVINADGTGNRAVTSGPDRDMDPTWSPDGAWLAFTRGPYNKPAIHIVRPDGSGLRKITVGAAREGHAAWS